MRAPLFLISFALSSAACSGTADDSGQGAASQDESAAAAEGAGDAAVPAEDYAEEEETERYVFEYSWPVAVAAEAGLVEVLGDRAQGMKAEVAARADEDWEAAGEGDWTPRQHSLSEEWKVVADLQRYLSLSGHLATYSGGAHGMYGLRSLVWDREAKQAMKGIALFNSPVALEQGLGQRLCDTLNAERAKRRGSPVEPGSGDTFDDCPGLDEASVLLGSSNGKTFDRLSVYFGPYVAGPYAEGDYELDFPVTASVLDAVKPDYADAFSVKR